MRDRPGLGEAAFLAEWGRDERGWGGGDILPHRGSRGIVKSSSWAA